MNNPSSLKSAIPYYVAAVIVTLSAGYGWRAIQARRTLKKAEVVLLKGRGALAAELLEPFREQLVTAQGGCPVLISSYYSARLLERLEWAVQACQEAEKESPEVYLGFAAHRELTGRESEALRILSEATRKYPSLPDFPYRMGQILEKLHRTDEAVEAILKATSLAPGPNQMIVEALEYFVKVKRGNEACRMADRIKDSPTEDPTLKFLLAQTYKGCGNQAAFEASRAAGEQMLRSRPELLVDLYRQFPDVVGKAPAKPATAGR